MARNDGTDRRKGGRHRATGDPEQQSVTRNRVYAQLPPDDDEPADQADGQQNEKKGKRR